MGVRSWTANALIARGRSIGRSAGCEMQVQLSDHSIETRMVSPDRDDLAWDDSLYRHGNVFLEGYANPVKPRVDRHKELEDGDTASLDETAHDATEADTSDSGAELISSGRYAAFMRQHLIEQLLNPSEHWRLIVYAVIGLAILQTATLFVALAAAGVF